MTGFLRVGASSNWNPVFAVVMLALPVVIGGADLIATNNKTQAAGTAQGRVYRVRERDLLSKVIKVEGIQNLDSPEFPKGFQVKVKNVSSKPIYYIYIHVFLPDTEPLRTGGYICFNLDFGPPKLCDSRLRLEDLPEDERQEASLASLEPGESCWLHIDNLIAERWRKAIETTLGSDHPATRNVGLTVQVINFGDGTGYLIGRPYPNNRKIGLGSPKELNFPGLNVHPGFTTKLPPKDSLLRQ